MSTAARAARTSGLARAPLAEIRPVLDGRDTDSRDRTELTGIDGHPLADIGLAPRLLATAAATRLRKAADATPPPADVFATAGELFATATLNGERPEEYRRRVTLATGATGGTIDRAMDGIRANLGRTELLNSAELPAPFAAPGFTTRWVPRGKVLAAIVPNNHPEPNVTWVRALSLGYSVLLRPGSKDPFTPRRLLAALLEAGLPAHKVAFLPGGHDLGDHLLTQADLGLVYGGPDAVARWTRRSDVLVRGPGRSKAVVDADSARELAGQLVDWIADDGGVRCNNISAVFTSGDVTALAEDLAERLAALPVLPILDPAATLPATGKENAEALRGYLAGLTAEATDHSTHRYGGDPIAQLPDGTHVMRPLVVSTDDPEHPLVGTELPFPFVVVAPLRAADGVRPLRDSLVVSVNGEHAALADELLLEPTVRKVVSGPVRPWTSRPELPHDGSLSGFLLEPKGLVMGVGG